jgi:hypothetical protein
MKLNLTLQRWAMKTESGGNAPCIPDINVDELCCHFHLSPPVVGWVGPTVGVEMVANIGAASGGSLTHSQCTVIAVWIDVVKRTPSVGAPVTIVLQWNT